MAPSPSQTFNVYDHNKDGCIHAIEKKVCTTFPRHHDNTDRFGSNEADSMMTQQALAYSSKVDTHNAAVLKQLGISI